MLPTASLTARVALAAERLRQAWTEAAIADALAALDARTLRDLGLSPSRSRPAHRFYL
jgi:hypothetical protein